MSIAYLNGEFMPLNETKISALDRGFLFADGVYEVIPVFNGKPFRLDEHLFRLESSLEKIKLPNPISPEEWQSIIIDLIERNNAGHQSIYLQITRGAANERNHAFPTTPIAPTLFLMSTPLQIENNQPSPIRAITCDDIRWKHCDIKSIALLPNILLRQQAIEQGAQEAILIRDNYVTEGAASNVFIVKDQVILTPMKNQFILGGITRDLLIELATTHQVALREEAITTNQLQTADEVWLTSSTKEILPVGEINGKLINNGEIGPVFSQMQEHYRQFKSTLVD